MKYPIFISVKDDLSIRIHSDEKSLNYYEQIDIENGQYTAWDSNGYLFNVLWSKESGIKLVQTSHQPQLDVMQKEIFRYIESTAKHYRPDKPFIYEKASNDLAGIFENLKKHIHNAPLKQRLINLLRRF